MGEGASGGTQGYLSHLVESLDQVQELLLRGLLQGPHVETPLTRWSIRQVCFASNVDHVEADLVFVESRNKVLDLGHEWMTFCTALHRPPHLVVMESFGAKGIPFQNSTFTP